MEEDKLRVINHPYKWGSIKNDVMAEERLKFDETRAKKGGI